MPKKNKQRKQRRSSRTRSKVRPIVYTGKTSFFPTLVAATAQSLSLQPNLLDPGILANLSDTFQLYRCISLRVKAYPEITSLGNTGVAYINGISDSGPGNIGNSLNMPFNLLIQGTITVPQSFSVPRNFLINQNSMKWWRTRVSTAGTPTTDSWENTQGQIWFFPQNSITQGNSIIEIFYTYEFSDPMVIGMTPGPISHTLSFPPPQRPLLTTLPTVQTPSSHVSECPYRGSQLQQAGECRFCRLLSLKEA